MLKSEKSENKIDISILLNRIDILTDIIDKLSEHSSTLFRLVTQEKERNKKLQSILIDIFSPIILSKCEYCKGNKNISLNENGEILNKDCICIEQIKQLKELLKHE